METVNNIIHDLSEIDEARHYLVSVAENLNFTEKAISFIQMAIDDAVTNNLNHGYKGMNGIKKEIFVSCRETSPRKGIEITVDDHGIGFDFNNWTEPDFSDIDVLLGQNQRGIFMMKTFMDKIEYKKLEHGTRVIMTKYV